MKFSVLIILLAALISCAGKQADEMKEDMTDNTSVEKPIAAEEYELVFISKGAIQCESTGLAPEITAKALTDAGISVIQSQCGQLTDVMFMARCGAGTGDINLHQIAKQDISTAQSLGFEPVSSLKTESSKGYTISECK